MPGHDSSARSTTPSSAVKREIDALGHPDRVAVLRGYFKTGPGDYGEGDVFVGVRMPDVRRVAKAHADLDYSAIDELLQSPVHEHRSVALVILSNRAKRAGADEGEELYDFYLARTDRINNWDLVDISCCDVVGRHLLAIGDCEPLGRLAGSDSIWERRIAIVSTLTFTRAGVLAPCFAISEQLLGDKEDLIHKAVGWMLREAGKKDEAALEAFLDANAPAMPRTALRYSIERMTPERRAYWRSRK